MMDLDLQVALSEASARAALPEQILFRAWAGAALQGQGPVQLTIRIVDEAEGAALNARYRHKQGPTNVLSFPFEAPPGVDLPLLGDIVICAPVVAREAAEQGKPTQAHWAHLVVHGCLHLQGYDHIEPEQAEEMEEIERRILQDLGYADPY